MKRLAILLACLALAGCKKAMSKLEEDTQLGKDEKVKLVNRQGDLTVGGGGGAVQAVRKAAARTINFNDLDQIHKLIYAAEIANGSIPNAQQILQDIRQAANKLAAGIDEGIIILTNNTQREGILAYTQWPQRANEHYVIRLSGVTSMARSDLETALRNQGTQDIRLAN